MPVPTRIQPEKNIWVAAGDGDLERVRELIEQHSVSPNDPDAYTYTPMHAAASYGQLEVLEYLIAHGGDVNVTDSDGDTPLYVVENIETARFLVEHGATTNRRNAEEQTPAEALATDFPAVSAYLAAADPSAAPHPSPPSQHAQDAASEALTAALMESVGDIMRRAEAEGRDPEPELRAVVGRTVLEGVAAGLAMTAEGAEAGADGRDARGDREADADADGGGGGAKRARTDDGPS